MKKFLCVLIACFLLISFVACGETKENTSTAEPTTVETTDAGAKLPTEEPSVEPTEEPTEAPSEIARPDVLQFIVNSDGSASNGVEDGPEVTSHGAAKVVEVDGTTGLNTVKLSGGTCLYNAEIGDYYGDMEDDFTLEVYFKVDALPGTSYAGIAENCEAGGFGLYVYADGKMEYDLMLDGKYQVTVAPSKVTLGKWYHCVCVWDETLISMYVDGVLVDTYDSDFAYVKFPADATAQYLAIGGCCTAGNHGGGGFVGSIGVCNLYTTALSADDVATSYRNLMQ